MENASQNFLAMVPHIYGRHWKTNVGKHLGFTGPTLRKWARNQSDPPLSVLILLALYTKLGWIYVREENRVRKVRHVSAKD